MFPRPGWVDHDATEIWENVRDCVHVALARAGISRHGLAAIGITNQRETCVLWDRATGRPIHNAIVWQDTRTDPIMAALAEADALGRDRLPQQTGLPLASTFSPPTTAPLLNRKRA